MSLLYPSSFYSNWTFICSSHRDFHLQYQKNYSYVSIRLENPEVSRLCYNRIRGSLKKRTVVMGRGNNGASTLIDTDMAAHSVDTITHKTIQVNGLNLHVAEIGCNSSPAFAFLHGFPGIWYTWRNQMIAVAKAGYRAIAVDYRGYGLSDPPAEPEKTYLADFVSDIAQILDSLAISKVFLIGRDFGSMVGYSFSLRHPEKVAGIITLALPYMPPGALKHHLDLPEGFYVRRWQEPGRAEADFGRFDAKTVIRNIYILLARSDIPIAGENQEIMELVKPSAPLPPWFTEEDLATYGHLYEKSGFQTALQVPYRAVEINIGYTLQDPKVEAPAMLIIGEEDYVLKYPGMDEYIRNGEVKKYVPNLETIYVPRGSHFVNEQFPDLVNQLILTFLDKNKHHLAVHS